MTESRTEKNKKIRNKINKIDKKEKSKKIVIILLKIILILALLVTVSFIMLRYIATYGLAVKEYSIEYDNLPEQYHGFKVVHFSDLYYGSSVDRKTLKDLVNKINKIKPDLILFTGGVIYKDYNLTDKDKTYIEETLSKLNSTVGKYYVTSKDDDENSVEILNNSNFVLLDDKYEFIYYKGNTPILINGVINKQNTDILEYEGTFNITITHEPDNIDDILNYVEPNIVMSGNSFNGQIRIPYIGGLLKFDGSKKYYEKYYKVNNTDLYISNGIGTKNYPLRLFNHPSINFYRLKTKK